jgi:3-deoxy-7-phosphoheptulonate synthase
MSKGASAREFGEVLMLAREQSGDSSLVDIVDQDGRATIVIGSLGHSIDPGVFENLPGVESVEGADLYKLARSEKGLNGKYPAGRIVEIPFAGARIGSEQFVVMAGPCAVEDEATLFEIARRAKAAGAKILRGGAFKPRTSPYCFQGLGEQGLELLSKVRDQVGIGVVTEAMEPSLVKAVSEVADIIQVGSRNMQNFPLLRAVGKQPKPVLLKRGMSATLEEWLAAAEYILAEGNPNVILCERGIRTFSRHSRHTLDLGVVPALKERSSLPVIVDPSHATGRSSRVPAMARAAIAAGADGLIVEIHTNPSVALSDGFQMLSLDEFDSLMGELGSIGSVIGKTI